MSTKNQREQAGGKNFAQEQMKMQTIEAVICPTEVWHQIQNSLRKLPVEDVEVLLMTMKAMRPQQVTMGLAPGQEPQG
jgi:hypothetical protein